MKISTFARFARIILANSRFRLRLATTAALSTLILTNSTNFPCRSQNAPAGGIPNRQQVQAQPAEEEDSSEAYTPDTNSGQNAVSSYQRPTSVRPNQQDNPGAPANRDPLQVFDNIMNDLIQQYNVPGGALAIAKDGRLVLARGYGLANVQQNVPFQPTTIFCLASVTKAVQGVSCMRLVDEGRLRLDDKVYDVLGKPKLGKVVDPRVYDITVRQLLHHSAGWKTDFVGYDQDTYNSLTQNGPCSFEQLFLWVMANKPLDYTPGTECHYSNYQFGGVKTVIEHASGQPFETYINEHVMFPMGIKDARLEPPRGVYFPNEAHRYGMNGRRLPGGHLNDKMTGSLGSWECSVVDMVKFLTAVDGTRTKPFLSKASFNEMVAPVPPPVPVRENGSTFGLGWDTVQRVDGGVHFAKGGGVPGVHTYIDHLPNNVDLVFFFNGLGANIKPKIQPAAIKALENAIANTQNWPTTDLFDRYK